MSAGIVWYKMQPDSDISAAVSDLLTDYCGPVKSHDVTVNPQRVSVLTAEILLRSNVVIFVGGMDIITPEQNIVFLISRTLGIPLERGKRSRSKYVFDTLHGTRLPSLKGSVLFPTRFGGPEGILLMSGSQTVIILPSMTRAAVIAAVSMRKFLAPYVSERRSDAASVLPEIPEPKEYCKFDRRHTRRKAVTREYSESGLNAVMERAVSYARRRSDINDYVSYEYPEEHIELKTDCEAQNEYYRKLSRAGKARNVISLIAVIGVIIALITAACVNPDGLL